MIILARFARFSIAAIFLCSAFAALADTAATKPSVSPALTVEAIRPEKKEWLETVAANGWLAAWQEAVVSAEISGQRITAVNVDIGDRVKTGDVLVELSKETLESEVRQKRASIEVAEAALEEATENGDRARQLTDSTAITKKQITEYLVAERKARANLESARADLDKAQHELEQANIRAVDDGIISARNAALGNVVSSGDELFRLIRKERIEWQAEIPLQQVPVIKEGTKAVIPTPFGDVQGSVRQVSPTASSANGRVTVYVALEELEDDLPKAKTGMLVGGYFKTGVSEALTVPETAVTLRDGFAYVYEISNEDPFKVSRLRVETGRRQDRQVEIKSGLDGSERLVKAGGAFLSDGSVVHLLQEGEGSDPGVAEETGSFSILKPATNTIVGSLQK